MGRPQELERYQASASVMLALLKMPAAWYQLSLLFLAPDVSFRCVQPYIKSLDINETLEEVWDNLCWFTEGNDETLRRCEVWKYDRRDVESSVNMEWNLVCDKAMLVTWAQFSFMSGVFLGNVIGGFMANRVGRKPVLVTAILCQPLLSAVVAIVPTFFLFLVFRFLLGLALGGIIVMSFVLGGEQATGPWRPAISILHQVPFGIGQTLLAATAYFIRDWRELQMYLTIYSLIFLPYCWFIEESPQWLETMGKLKQAERVREAIRRRNKKSDKADTEMDPMTTLHKQKIVKTDTKMTNTSVADSDRMGLWGLFRMARLCRYSLSIWTSWYCAGLAFFALNAYQTSLGGDPFINVGVGGLVGGIPGNIFTVFLLRRFGRKKVIIYAHVIASISAILIPVYDLGESPWDWQRRMLGLTALVAMAVAFPAMFLASGEILPQGVRPPVMGVANLMARLGNTMAPLAMVTSKLHSSAPLWVVSAAPLVTAFVVASLPETANKPLPVHIQDIEPNKGRDVEALNPEESEQTCKPVPNRNS